MLKILVPAAVLLLAAPAAVSADTASKEIQRTLALDKDGRVAIEAYKGSIAVTAWDRPEVQVTARVEADDACGDATYQAEMVRDTQVRIEGGGDRVRIESDYDRARHRSSWRFFSFSNCSTLPFVRYTISMPKTARLDLKDYKSDIDITGLASDVRLSTYKGEARLTGLAGALRLDTYKGDVRVAFAKMSGDSSFETHKGEIEITLPRDARFAISADVGRRGSFHSDFPVTVRTGSRRGRDERVEAAINGGGPELRLATSNGSFRLRSS